MIELHIERLAYGGDAIARLDDGRTAFVRGGCPGDTVAFVLEEDKGRFVRGSVESVISASTDRVRPQCPFFGECGGCHWQHIAYERQLCAKRDEVADALARIGHLDGTTSVVSDTVASPTAYGYRNKIELVVDASSPRPLLGFHRAGSDRIVPVDQCLLLPKNLRRAPKALNGALRYLAGESDLGINRVALRAATHTRDVEIALWTAPAAFPRTAAAKTLGQAVPATSIVRVLSKANGKGRKVAGVEVLSGKGCWRERVSGHSFTVSAPSFFQVNTKAAELLVELVLDALQPDGTDRVLDLYAGAGTFTLPLAAVAGEVVAVEAAGSAVRDLRRNLEENALWAEVVGGDAAREFGSLGRFDLVVVDPPRAGLDAAVIGALGRARPRALAYVSCDPATLARDAARLADAGYTLTQATPVDLFPQTYHIETVARFERTGG